jgi:hypothetical protein
VDYGLWPVLLFAWDSSFISYSAVYGFSAYFDGFPFDLLVIRV